MHKVKSTHQRHNDKRKHKHREIWRSVWVDAKHSDSSKQITLEHINRLNAIKNIFSTTDTYTNRTYSNSLKYLCHLKLYIDRKLKTQDWFTLNKQMRTIYSYLRLTFGISTFQLINGKENSLNVVFTSILYQRRKKINSPKFSQCVWVLMWEVHEH